MAALYNMSVPIYLRALNNQKAILQKAEKHCEENNISKETMLSAQIHDDMKPLTFQVQSASNGSKLSLVRVCGVENEPWDDNETTFEQLIARVDKTIAFIEKVGQDKFEGKSEAEVVLKLGSAEYKFTGLSFLQTFSIPNFFFHHTMTYAILRKEGVPVGKWDYLGKA
ncbi:hypothetical protein LTR78_009468 [Recurvomyces mirabilis]|uniref:DUF1993 domain-containing protein n=1 Tax=Recurvomyces mirabilis TaxID=574656 RepID=A0AAE0TNH0_9PEZI|nr:hypothetical protein LTR78_009468 [Recurvomyces mirabilis]KAK5152373.1 hypothetical protein LTS14_008320 [Recurvomyces mirabilis]